MSFHVLRLSALIAMLALTACQAPVTQGAPRPSTLQIQTDAGVSHASRKLQNNLISVFDRNGDGRLDKHELKIPLLLRLLDRNFDGYLTPDELRHPLADKAITTFLRQTSKQMFNLADRNNDARLSYQEFIVTSDMDHKLMKVLFQMVDNNFDDHLALGEYEDFIAQSIAIGSDGFDWLTRSASFQDAVNP